MTTIQKDHGTARIRSIQEIVVPRPVIRAGLLCRPGCQDLPSVIQVARGQDWVSRWTTVGCELPHGQDWLWYLAILACHFKAKANYLLEFKNKADVHRLAASLGAGTTGGDMTRLAASAIRRLCQARFGWYSAAWGNGNSLASQQMTTDPILRISSALAAALWGLSSWPIGLLVEDDDRLWIAPTSLHSSLQHLHPFHIPKVLIRDMAARMDHLSIGLIAAAYAQATQDGYTVKRPTWDGLVTRLTTCPHDRVHRRVEEATAHFMATCDVNGYKNAITIKYVPPTNAKRDHIGPYRPGRPKATWGFRISPARPPFVRR